MLPELFNQGWVTDPSLFHKPYDIHIKNYETPDYEVNLDYYFDKIDTTQTFHEAPDNLYIQSNKIEEEDAPICCISKKYIQKIDTELGLEYENDDAAWIMSTTFMMFTMQTGQWFPNLRYLPPPPLKKRGKFRTPDFFATPRTVFLMHTLPYMSF